MRLIGANKEEVQIGISHQEFMLLKEWTEDAGERDHGMVFEHPELLAGFRAAKEELIRMWEEGVFDYEET